MKKIITIVLAFIMALSLVACGESKTANQSTQAVAEQSKPSQVSTNIVAQATIEQLETPQVSIKPTAKPTPQPTEPAIDDNEGITIECPKTIESDGVTIEIKDIYIKCKNSESVKYNYDGNFLYASAEIKKVKKNVKSFAIYFDMFDKNDRYLGDIIILYTKNIDATSVGKMIHDDTILSATGVAKIVYKG